MFGKEKVVIKKYVINKHGFKISMMKTCDIADKFEELRGTDIKNKRGIVHIALARRLFFD